MLGPDNGLPGSIGLAVHEGALPRDAPGLDDLAALIRPHPKGFTVEGERLDEIGWPIKNDAAIALVAADIHPSLPSELCPIVEVVRRWIGGEAMAEGTLRHGWHLADAHLFATRFFGAPGDRIEMIFHTIHGDDLPEDVIDALQGMPIEDRRAVEIVEAVTSAAMSAERGWLAYHAHRRLASFTAESALRALKLSVDVAGDVWSRAIDEALRLARRGV